MYNKANLLQFEVCLRQRMVDDGVRSRHGRSRR